MFDWLGFVATTAISTLYAYIFIYYIYILYLSEKCVWQESCLQNESFTETSNIKNICFMNVFFGVKWWWPEDSIDLWTLLSNSEKQEQAKCPSLGFELVVKVEDGEEGWSRGSRWGVSLLLFRVRTLETFTMLWQFPGGGRDNVSINLS